MANDRERNQRRRLPAYPASFADHSQPDPPSDCRVGRLSGAQRVFSPSRSLTWLRRLAAFVLSASFLLAQPNQPGYWEPFKKFPKDLLLDQKAIWTSPAHSSKSDLKWWLIFGGATAGLIAIDSEVLEKIPQNGEAVNVGSALSNIGAAYTLVPASALMYFIGTHRGDDRLRETGYLGLQALADAYVVDEVFKVTTQRQRPNEGNGNGLFWQGSVWNSSFPSGHATESWALASVVAREYSHKKWVPIVAYSLAGTVTVSRILARKHFPSDVVVGSAVGWFIGDYVYRKHHSGELKGWRKVFDYVSIGGM